MWAAFRSQIFSAASALAGSEDSDGKRAAALAIRVLEGKVTIGAVLVPESRHGDVRDTNLSPLSPEVSGTPQPRDSAN